MSAAGRAPLSRARVVTAAAGLADGDGLHAVSMRKVAAALGVEAMSLYHHVPTKAALLDELVDWVMAQIPAPRPGVPWREAMERRAGEQRRVLAAHPWSLSLIESRRSPGPALLRHHDAVLGCLRTGGFPVRLAGHAFSVLDAYVYGFVVTELQLPFDGGDERSFAEGLALSGTDYPYLAEFVEQLVQPGEYALRDEFEVGLTIILDELERRRRAVAAS